MNKNLIKLLSAFVAIGAATFSVAQGGGDRGDRGGMRGQFGGMMGGRGGMMQDRTGMMLLGRADVQRDLNLSVDQKSKLEAMQTKMREEMRSTMENAMASGGGDREAMRTMMQQMQERSRAEVAKILTPAQVTRLGEIRVQLMGNRAVMDPDIQKQLNVTDAQKGQIENLRQKQQEANQAIRERMRNQEIDREAAMTSMRRNDEVMNTELGKILTAAQRDKLKAMGGKPFQEDRQDI